MEILYTRGGPDAHQAVISGSMDIACGGGIESAVGAYAKGAPVRIIGSAMIGSPDTYWFMIGAGRGQKSGLSARGTSASFPEYHWMFSAQASSSHSFGLMR